MKYIKLILFLSILFSAFIFAETPKEKCWKNEGTFGKSDFISIELEDGNTYKYLAYNDELSYVIDFRDILLDDGYSKEYVKAAKLCYDSINWGNNNEGLSSRVQQTMVEGKYNILHLILLDEYGNLTGFLINKLKAGNFYLGVMVCDEEGNWFDFTTEFMEE